MDLPRHTPQNVPVLRVGLTGGIGSGKSTVAARLASRGAAVIDADALSRSITAAGGLGIPAIAQAFGPASIGPDGAMDRERMRALVFQDPAAKKRLEHIIHPLVSQETQRQAREAIAHGRHCLVFDVPLLVESGHWRSRVDRVLVVDCAESTQIARVMARNGLPEATVAAIIASQAPRAARLAAADIVLFNEGISKDALHQEIDQVATGFGL